MDIEIFVKLIDVIRREANLIDRLYCILAKNGIADTLGDDFEQEIADIAHEIETIDK